MKKILSLAMAFLMIFSIGIKADDVETAEAVKTYQPFVLDGETVEIGGYLINQNNYFKLRDLAAILAETDAKFDVTYEDKQVKLVTNKAYEKLESDLQPMAHDKTTAKMVENKITIDGKEAVLKAALIDQNNYVMLRDLAKFINYEVGYDKETKEILVTTKFETKAEDKTEAIKNLKVLGIKGPTGMALAPLKEALGDNINISASIPEQVAAIKNDLADVYILPSNLYAKLVNSGAKLQLLSSNAGNVLDILGMNELKSIADLKGKTVALTGRGAVPEIILKKLLEANGLKMEDLNVIYLGEPTEAAGVIKKDKDAYLLLPQPFATAIKGKIEGLKSVMNVSEEWAKAEFPEIITAVVVAKKPVYEKNKEAMDAFVEAYRNSVDKLISVPADYAKIIEEMGIIKDKIAEKALANIKYVDLQGEALEEALTKFFSILAEKNAELIGGKVPVYEK